MARHVTATIVVDRTLTGVGYVWEFHQKKYIFLQVLGFPCPHHEGR